LSEQIEKQATTEGWTHRQISANKRQACGQGGVLLRSSEDLSKTEVGKGKTLERVARGSIEKFQYIEQNSPELADDIFVLERLEQEEKERLQASQVILWIIDHQLDRRNISLYSRGRLINRKRSEYTKEAEKRML